MSLATKENGELVKMRRRLMKLRLRSIPVFCFHQVSEIYNPQTMWECDWTQLDQFKRIILRLREKYVFLSLQEAHEKIKHDVFRLKNYAVLTADDGYRSLLNVLPWLEEQNIPITLFVNTKYLDGHSWSYINEEQARRTRIDVDMLNEVCPDLYLSEDELFSIDSSWVSVGLHGHEHMDVLKQTESEFCNNVKINCDILAHHPRFVPYYAYPWGHHSEATDRIIRSMGFTPVLMSGARNYNDSDYIDRICIDRLTN